MKERCSAEQIVGLLRRGVVDLATGETAFDVRRRPGVSQQTYSRGGPGPAAKRWLRRHGSDEGPAPSAPEHPRSDDIPDCVAQDIR